MGGGALWPSTGPGGRYRYLIALTPATHTVVTMCRDTSTSCAPRPNREAAPGITRSIAVVPHSAIGMGATRGFSCIMYVMIHISQQHETVSQMRRLVNDWSDLQAGMKKLRKLTPRPIAK